MTTALYIIIGILFFGILVGIHELGHFAAAKACNIRVNEFSVGMGPAIFQKQRGETLYALRAVPFGGYCAMAEDDGESDDPRAFVNQKAWKKLLVLSAGSFMNFILGLIIALLLTIGARAFAQPVIVGFAEGCPYESAEGLQVGDRFLRINGNRIWSYSDLGEYITSEGGDYDLVIRRDGRRIRLEGFSMTPLQYEGEEGLKYGFYFGYQEANFSSRIRYMWNTSMEWVKLVWTGLDMLFTGEAGVNDLSGPVGIVDLMAETGEAAEDTADAVFSLLYLGGFIAVNLAIMNMLPFPALDGGRVFLLLVTCVIEFLSGKKLNPKYEAYIHTAGMIILLALMAYVMFHDIIKVFLNG